EKFLKDNEDKVPGEVKTEVEESLTELKEKLKAESAEGDNTAEIRTATEKAAAVSQKLGQAIYAQAQGAHGAHGAQAAGGPEAGAPGGEHKAADDEVVDAEIVDDDKPEAG
ncbi:molecular chaperone DnaK, partial [Streptomyces sp. NPDC055144]